MEFEGWSLQKVEKEEGRENHWFEGRAKNVIERGRGDIFFKLCIIILITMFKKSLFIL